MIVKFQKFMIRALKCRVNRFQTMVSSNFIQKYILGSFAVNGSCLGGKGKGGESYTNIGGAPNIRNPLPPYPRGVTPPGGFGLNFTTNFTKGVFPV